MTYKWFFAPLLAFFVFSIWGQSAEIPSAFSIGGDAQLHRLSTLPVSAVLQVKFSQENVQYPMDIALFGNSISLPVVPSELLMSGQNAFNFAVPGTSFQSSVTLLQSLLEEGRQIKLAIIQVDNFEAIDVEQLPWPRGPVRMGLLISRIASGLTEPRIGPDELLRMVWRSIKSEAIIFAGFFNIQKIWAYLAYRFPNWLPSIPTSTLPYSVDGSLPRLEITVPRTHELLSSHGAMLPGYFAKDLGRVAQLSTMVDRIVLVEMPLEPTSAAYYVYNPTLQGAQFRGMFSRICNQLDLECHVAPISGDPGQPNFWADETHPSAQWLAAYLRQIILSEASRKRALQP